MSLDAIFTRSAAAVHGVMCFALLAYTLVPLAFHPSPNMKLDGQAVGPQHGGVILSFVSKEEVREAGGALVMAQAMWLCYSAGRPSDRGYKASVLGPASGIACTVVAFMGIVLALWLPGHLRRAGFVGPSHCG